MSSIPERLCANITPPMQGEVLWVQLAPASTAKANLETAALQPAPFSEGSPFWPGRFMSIHASGGEALVAFVQAADGATPTDLTPAAAPTGSIALSALETGGVLPADVTVDVQLPQHTKGKKLWILLASSAGCRVRMWASSEQAA